MNKGFAATVRLFAAWLDIIVTSKAALYIFWAIIILFGGYSVFSATELIFEISEKKERGKIV